MLNELNRDELFRILADIHFDERYYALYEHFRDRSGNINYTQDDVMAALAGTGLDFSYHPREKFYAYKEQHSSGTLGLHLAVPCSTVEFILVLQSGGKEIGGPFPALARNTALLRDPSFSYEPRSPKIPFANLSELQQIVQEGIALFQDIKRAFVVRSHTSQL